MSEVFEMPGQIADPTTDVTRKLLEEEAGKRYAEVQARLREQAEKPLTNGRYFHDMIGSAEEPGLVPKVQTHEGLLTYVSEMGNAVYAEIADVRKKLDEGSYESLTEALKRVLDLVEWTVVCDDRLTAWAERKRLAAVEEHIKAQRAEAEAAVNSDPGVSPVTCNPAYESDTTIPVIAGR